MIKVIFNTNEIMYLPINQQIYSLLNTLFGTTLLQYVMITEKNNIDYESIESLVIVK